MENKETDFKNKKANENQNNKKNNSHAENIKEQLKIKDAEIESLKNQLSDEKEKLLRTVADTENLKKRLQKDKEEAIAFANKNLVVDILPAIDGLDAAISTTENEDIRKGIEMARDSFLNTLKKWGLEVIDDEGKEYDPNRHEACLFETSSDATFDTVMQTLQRGYALHSRVVRPSKVKVLKAE